MTLERQNTVIAIQQGWVREQRNTAKDHSQEWWWIRRGKMMKEPANYVGSLAQMRELEDYLIVNGRWDQYVEILKSLVEKKAFQDARFWGHAPSELRAEAFLRVLGLWEENLVVSDDVESADAYKALSNDLSNRLNRISMYFKSCNDKELIGNHRHALHKMILGFEANGMLPKHNCPKDE